MISPHNSSFYCEFLEMTSEREREREGERGREREREGERGREVDLTNRRALTR